MRYPQNVSQHPRSPSVPLVLPFGTDYPSKRRFGSIVAACLAYTLLLFWTT
jgi:hypothetical protein